MNELSLEYVSLNGHLVAVENTAVAGDSLPTPAITHTIGLFPYFGTQVKKIINVFHTGCRT